MGFEKWIEQQVFGVIGIIIVVLLYRYFTKRLSTKEISEMLKICIYSLGDEFASKLVVSVQNEINSMISIYFREENEVDLVEIAKLLKKKYKPSRYSSVGAPAVVMRCLIREIISEQLKMEFDNGFIFSKEVFENMKYYSPFLNHYCIIAKISENSYFSDLLVASPSSDTQKMIYSSFGSLLQKKYKHAGKGIEQIYIPESPVFVSKSKKILGYQIKFTDIKQLDLTLKNETQVRISSMILAKRGWLSHEFNLVGRNSISPDEFSDLNSVYKMEDCDFLSVCVCKKRVKIQDTKELPE